MKSQCHSCSQLLEQLKAMLIAQGWWQSELPSEVALASQMPFACDTMPFENWLQFIFLVKMQPLLQAGQLPEQLALTPAAQALWQGKEVSADLMECLTQIDQHCCKSPVCN